MCIISIDVGIKNLAICIVEKYEDNNSSNESINSNYTIDSEKVPLKFNILYWNVLSLIKETNPIFCSMLIKSGKNKGKQCTKIAKIKSEKVLTDEKTQDVFCAVHNPYKKESELTKRNTIPVKSKTYVKNIPNQKLCILLFETLDKLPIEYVNKAKEVLIEQQPSFNPKMKMLSFMIYSYFIRNGVMTDVSKIKNVKFISPKNKLKVYNGPPVECNLKTKYSRTKKLGIEYCKYMIQNDIVNSTFFNTHSKKDDLSDSALMAFWYLSGMNKRNYTKKISGTSGTTPKKNYFSRRRFYKKKK